MNQPIRNISINAWNYWWLKQYTEITGAPHLLLEEQKPFAKKQQRGFLLIHPSFGCCPMKIFCAELLYPELLSLYLFHTLIDFVSPHFWKIRVEAFFGLPYLSKNDAAPILEPSNIFCIYAFSLVKIWKPDLDSQNLILLVSRYLVALFYLDSFLLIWDIIPAVIILTFKCNVTYFYQGLTMLAVRGS